MNDLHLYNLGSVDYLLALDQQRSFVDQRRNNTVDEIWCLQHPPVYTLGLSGKTEHVHDRGTIPVVRSDRGGQVTYHGPGQLVVYPLLDLKRRNITVKNYVSLLEQAIIETVETYGIKAHRIGGAPGVYVDNSKLAALGIRIRRGNCYHGISINIDMDLSPYDGINPCGYQGLKVTQLKDLGVNVEMENIIDVLAASLVNTLGYNRYVSMSYLDKAARSFM